MTTGRINQVTDTSRCPKACVSQVVVNSPRLGFGLSPRVLDAPPSTTELLVSDLTRSKRLHHGQSPQFVVQSED